MDNRRPSDYVIEHVSRDLKSNKSLNGIDFSQFLAEYLGVCTGARYLTPERRENFGRNIPLKLITVQDKLSNDVGKPVRFVESAKAGVAIIKNMFDEDELTRVDEYAEGLVTEINMDYFDINDTAMRYFTSPITDLRV